MCGAVVFKVGATESKWRLTSGILRQAGFTVVEAATGAEVLDTATREAPELVLLYGAPPDLNVGQISQMLKSKAGTASTVVVHITPESSKSQSGADICLREPVRPEDLTATVALLAQRHGCRVHAGASAHAVPQPSGRNWYVDEILDRITDSFVCFDREWRYLYLNGHAAALAGRPVEELLGRCIWELFPETVGHSFYNLLHQAVAEGRCVERTRYSEHFGKWLHHRVYPNENGVIVFTTDVTAQHRAQEALREQEENLRRKQEILQTIFDHIPVMIDFVDGAGRIELVNRCWSDTLGWSLADVRERDLFDEFFPDATVRARALRCIQNPPAGFTEFKIRTRHGSVIDTSWAHVPLSDGTRIGIGLDITESNLAKEALTRRLAEIEAIYSTAPVGLCVLDAEFRHRRINERLAAMVGRSVKDLLGRTVREIVPHLADRVEAGVRQVFATGQPLLGMELSSEACGEPGNHRDFIVHWCPLKEMGAMVGVNAVVEEVTEPKRMARALQESEERFRAWMEATDTLFWTAAPDGTIGESQGFSGGIPSDGQHWGWLAAVHQDDRERALQAWQQACLRVENYECEARLWHAQSGEYRWYLARAVPQFHADGRVRGWVGAGIDVEKRKEAEAALKEADRRKDEFLAMLGHELRNPLAPIRNAVQLLKEIAPLDPKLRWAREVIERQVGHLARLVDDLLDVSRLVRGKIVLRAERIDIAALLEQALEVSRPLIQSHRHELTVSVPDEPVWIEGDVVRLTQVLENLLTNAAKYTPECGQIWVDASREHGEAVIRVRDTGIGINAELLPAIFELFTQDARGLDRRQGGLGVGLTIVKKLVALHGGRVEAYSAGRGLGSIFVVRLPLHAAPAETERALAPRPEASARGQPRSILLVDDNVDAAESLAMLLRFEGHLVKTALDGPSALDLVAKFEPEVIFLDIGLPGMDGYEVARRVRARAGSQHTTIVALTGYGQSEDRSRSQAAGFDDHLVKPVDPAELKRLLFKPALGRKAG